MGFGSTAKKVQRIADVAEKTYQKLNEVLGDVQALREDFEETSETVDDIERELAEQRALVEALADQQGVDVETVRAEAGETDGGGAEEASDAEESGA